MAIRHIVAAAGFTALLASPALAVETVTYTYDALGRLVTVSHSGTQNNGQVTTYSYDQANNRTNVTITGAPH